MAKTFMWDNIILPSLQMGAFVPFEDKSNPNNAAGYWPRDWKNCRPRSHLYAEILAKELDPEIGIQSFQLFSNPLLTAVDEPSKAAMPYAWNVFTFEWDVDSPEFLAEQFSWADEGGKLDLLYDVMAHFEDFYGVTANFSGSKSLHIHIVMDLHVIGRLSELTNTQFRDGYKNIWKRLADVVRDVMSPSCSEDLDTTLDQPEKWRRLPNGMRGDVLQETKFERYRDDLWWDFTDPNGGLMFRTMLNLYGKQRAGDTFSQQDDYQRAVKALAKKKAAFDKMMLAARSDVGRQLGGIDLSDIRNCKLCRQEWLDQYDDNTDDGDNYERYVLMCRIAGQAEYERFDISPEELAGLIAQLRDPTKVDLVAEATKAITYIMENSEWQEV